MRRWAVVGVGCWLLGSLVEVVLGAPLLSLLFFVPSALSLPINAVILVAWLGLRLPLP